ncbi:YbaB/EbfC family nucleoid-associated protein [Actinoplanes hulinensis]|uniref:YbaB/EbfC family nucleoid-associated protein n=1 Tax=Actinoplanes hulinensis TaxID=1144547 RepID=A0ABS7BGL3_9ACTN|nr:YbaB/EbfC family nucleoid-associated protein [Actinoplanes hulinensis]MBW6440016.1 YbaB/EbfC family nucleoid-associated protein [Actinoplanes hulinensis]
MFDDRMDALVGLRDDGEALLRRAQSATRAIGEPGLDSTGSVTVTLDEHGRVATMTVASHWRSCLADDRLGEAVVEAVRDAAMRRLTAWGEAYIEPAVPEAVPPAADLQQRLDSITSSALPSAEREIALVALLEVVESIEQGLDEVTGRLDQTLSATQTGHSPHREVTVELTGGGDVTAVRFDRRWLRDAHDANLSRQLTTAFRAAYEQVAANGVRRLIADSPLGHAQMVMRDPAGFARRFGLAG